MIYLALAFFLQRSGVCSAHYQLLGLDFSFILKVYAASSSSLALLQQNGACAVHHQSPGLCKYWKRALNPHCQHATLHCSPACSSPELIFGRHTLILLLQWFQSITVCTYSCTYRYRVQIHFHLSPKRKWYSLCCFSSNRSK